MTLYVYTFYKLLACRAIIFYNSLLNHCLVSLDKVWILINNQNLDSVFKHRMWRLYVKRDEVDQQITERNWIWAPYICWNCCTFWSCLSCPNVTSSSTVFSKQLDIPQVSVASKFLLTIDNGLYLLCVNQSFVQKWNKRSIL